MPCHPLLNDEGKPVGFVCTAPWGMGTTDYGPEAGEEYRYVYGFGGSSDPHDFDPAFEENSPREIAAWKDAKAACKCGREETKEKTMNTILRAKIKMNMVKSHPQTSVDDPAVAAKSGEEIQAGAVYSEDKTTENYAFSVATPSLTLSMYISNPDAFGKLIQGKEYYLDFTPVEAEAPAELGVDYGSRL